MYVAVREAAAARLYTRVPWLRPRVIDTIAQIASGFRLIWSQLRSRRAALLAGCPLTRRRMPEIDMTKIFVLELSDEQEDSVARLQLLLSLDRGLGERGHCPRRRSASAQRGGFA